MKQVIFVCLLSLSVCLSQPSKPLEDTTKASPLVTPPNGSATVTKPNDSKQPDHPAENATEGATKPTKVITEAQNGTAANATQTQTTKPSNETPSKPNETTAADKTNSATATKPADTTVKPTEKSDADTTGKPTEKSDSKTTTPAAPATNGTNADGKDSKKNETTTPKAENVSPTATPIEAKTRAFDGPSFIGGIILTLGLLAIGFMGFKYYKNQTERNYHTL